MTPCFTDYFHTKKSHTMLIVLFTGPFLFIAFLLSSESLAVGSMIIIIGHAQVCVNYNFKHFIICKSISIYFQDESVEFSLVHLKGPFLVLLGGSIISLLIFIAEILHSKRKN